MLTAIDSRDLSVVHYMLPIYNLVESIISRSEDPIPHYKDIITHDTVIKSYQKNNGTCSILTETAAGYYTYMEKGGKVIKRYKNKKKQTSYETELIYIQNIQPEKTTIYSAFLVQIAVLQLRWLV